MKTTKELTCYLYDSGWWRYYTLDQIADWVELDIPLP